ncbi:hypothetical protein BJ322DRAFT_1017951 [Thelephora terrestris]|uniref:Uncharacterized protein n=1 Tax=Thelephora terrestris TaxID=56493 RepID=A0A9P6HNE8_9AGAM|nr:hypothetical protein BJ322DRAFT_1017951 [Thelephora terrestris]
MQSEDFVLARLERSTSLIQRRLENLVYKLDELNKKLDMLLAQFGVEIYSLDSRGFSSAANTGWSGPSFEEQFGGSMGEASNLMAAESNPGIAPNDTLLQCGNCFEEHDDGGIAGGSYNPPQAEIPPLQPTTSTLPASMVFVDGMWMDPPANSTPFPPANPSVETCGHGVWADGLGQGAVPSTPSTVTEPYRAEDDI